MIVKMTKYSFVFLSENESALLGKLQETGLLDITRSAKPIDDHSSELLQRAETLRKRIEDIESDNFSRDEEYNRLASALDNARKEYSDRLPWGSFDKARLDGLESKGVKIRFYCVPTKKFNASWSEIQPLEVIQDNGSNTWFVTAGPVEGYDFPVQECKAPDGPASESSAQVSSLESLLEERKTVLSKEKETVPTLRADYAEILDSLELYLAQANSEYAAEDKLCVLQGFAPATDDAKVKAMLDTLDGVYWTSEPAVKEDNPPIKLKNNWFARQFETLTGMYGMPVYDEWDPTPILAPFYLLFFSLCMGDAGYGLVLIAIAYAFKGMKGEGPMGLAPYWKLIRSLGIGTFIVGLFLGTLFGVSLADAAWFPQSLKGLLLVGSVGQFPLQMVLAIGVGVFHICLAMVVKTILFTQRFGFKSNISTWGWTLLIVGGLVTFAICSVAHLSAGITKWMIIALAVVSALGIFVFNKPGRNPLLNIGAGLWDTYQMATGLLGDVLSYIRLYALGLAGGMLGSAFNTLGGLVLGDNPTFQWVFFALIVLFGHALNLAMSCLGAFVHPLRLTFVEYFKNAGYEGRGIPYKAFKKQNNK